MAFPTILMNSSTGSDSAASGAGPATAVTGSKARVRSAGTTELQVGFFEVSAPDLSGVATDGSHVLFVNDSVSGNRNFASIAATKDTDDSTSGNITTGTNSLVVTSATNLAIGQLIRVAGAGTAGADLYTTISNVSGTTITLTDNASTTVSGAAVWSPKQVTLTSGESVGAGSGGIRTTDTTWAIGGKRLTMSSTTSRKLIANTTSDMMPGWIMSLEAGFTDTFSSVLTSTRAGSSSGRIKILGPTSGTKPKLTNSGLITTINLTVAYWNIENIDFEGTNATKSNASLIGLAVGNGCIVKNCSFGKNSNTFYSGLSAAGTSIHIENCEFVGNYYAGLASGNQSGVVVVKNCYFRDSNSVGGNGSGIDPNHSTGAKCLVVENCIFKDVKNAFYQSHASVSVSVAADYQNIRNCTFYNSGTAAVFFNSAFNNGQALYNLEIENCIFVNNAGYAITINDGSWDLTKADYVMFRIRNCLFYNNSSGAISPTGWSALFENCQTSIDPKLRDPANGDFTPTNSQAVGIGYPTAYPGITQASYPHIGAIARQEASQVVFQQIIVPTEYQDVDELMVPIG